MAQKTITLKAGSIYPVTVAGKNLTIVSCTVAFKVEMDNLGYNSAVAGSQFSNADGFSRLSFSETKGVDNVITFDASDSPSPGRAVVIQSSAATFIGPNSNGYNVFPLGGSVTLPGIDAAGHFRKSITLLNRETVASGKLLDIVIGGTLVMAIKGEELPWTLETSADIVLAPSGASCLCFVLEIFYSNTLQNDQ